MTAKTKAADKKPPVIEVDAEQLNRIATIRNYKKDIASFKSKIKSIEADMLKIAEGTDEYMEVEKLTAQLEVARENLKRRLFGNSAYVDLTEDLADERQTLRDAERILSDYLLAHFADTHERQIELGPHEAHEVILKGKLGKEKDFQTNIFSAPAQEGGSNG